MWHNKTLLLNVLEWRLWRVVCMRWNAAFYACCRGNTRLIYSLQQCFFISIFFFPRRHFFTAFSWRLLTCLACHTRSVRSPHHQAVVEPILLESLKMESDGVVRSNLYALNVSFQRLNLHLLQVRRRLNSWPAGRPDRKPPEEGEAHVLLHPLPELAGAEVVLPRRPGQKRQKTRRTRQICVKVVLY